MFFNTWFEPNFFDKFFIIKEPELYALCSKSLFKIILSSLIFFFFQKYLRKNNGCY